MNGPLTRLKGLAIRPLWDESALQRARRRCRMLVATPFAALAGITWGAFAAPTIGVGSPLLWGAIGGLAFPLFMYVEQKLVPPLTELARRAGLGRGNVAALAWEAAVVGGLVYLLTSVLGAPTVPAVGTALSVGALYALLMEYVVCGSAASDVAALIGGGGLGSRGRAEDLSRAEALAKRGDREGAIGIYRRAIESRPREGATYARLARTLVEAGEHEEALAVLRSGFLKATLSPDREAFLLRQIHEVCVTKLAEPERCLDDLRIFLEHEPDGRHAAWARREIEDIEAGLYDV